MAKKKIHYFAVKNITLSGATRPGQVYNAEYVLGEYLILRRKNGELEVITEPDRIERFHAWFTMFVASKTGEFFPCKGKALRAFETNR